MTVFLRNFLLAFLPILLVGCAVGDPAEEDVDKLVGMHIDAALEFAIEYPLPWSKTRQQNRDTGWGMVRWDHPDNPEISLTVHSFLKAPEKPDLEQGLKQFISELPNIEITHKEEVELQDNPALHVTGYTPQKTYDIHLLASSRRLLIFFFSAPPGLFSKNLDVLEEAVESFIVLEPSDASPRTD